MMQSLQSLIVSITPTLLALVVKATAMLCVAFVVAKCMRGSSAARRHFVWYLGVASSLGIVAMQFVVPPVAVRVAPTSILFPLATKFGAHATVADRSVHDGREHAMPETIASTLESKLQTTVSSARISIATDNAKSGAIAASAFNSARTADDGKPSAQLDASECTSSKQTAVSLGVSACPWFSQVNVEPLNLAASVALFWLCGACVLLGRFALAHVRLASIVRSARAVDDESWLQHLQKEMARFRTRDVRLLTHATVATPFTTGWLRPVIVLPEGAQFYSAERRQAVLTHELAHIARADYFAMCVATIACALYWFHPALWLAARSMRNESERAADDCVMATGMKAVRYAEHLLALADYRAELHVQTAALGMARASQLEWRLRAMLDTTKSRMGLSKRFARIGGAVSMLALVPLAGVRTEVGGHERSNKRIPSTNNLSSNTSSVDAIHPSTAKSGVLAAIVVHNDSTSTLSANLGNVAQTNAVAKMREPTRGAFSPLFTMHDYVTPNGTDIAKVSSTSPLDRSNADTVYDKILNVRDSVLIVLDMEARGGVNFIRRHESTINVHASLNTPRLGITTEGTPDSVRVHTFSTDGAKDSKGGNEFVLNLYIPYDAQVVWRTYSPDLIRTIDYAGGRMKIRGKAPLNLKPSDRTMIPRAIDTTPRAINAVQLRDTLFDQSIAAESGKTFNLNLPYGGDVVIHGWDEPRIRMNAMLTTRFGEGMRPTLVPVAPGLQLVTYRDARAVYEPLKWSLDSVKYNGHVTYSGKYRGNHYEFWVPRHTNIVLSSTGGTVTIADVDGDLSGKTDYGFVDVQNAHGSMNFRTILGSINVLNSTLTGVSSTQCGNVNAARVNGALDLRTAEGDHTSDINGVPGDVTTYSDGSFSVRVRACNRSF